MRKLHGTFVCFWVLMAFPAFFFWKESILFVIAMSLYANIEASFAAFLSAKKPKPKRRPRLLFKEVTFLKRGSK